MPDHILSSHACMTHTHTRISTATTSPVAASSSSQVPKDQHTQSIKTEVTPDLPKTTTTIQLQLPSTKVEKSSTFNVKEKHRQPTFGDLARSPVSGTFGTTHFPAIVYIKL